MPLPIESRATHGSGAQNGSLLGNGDISGVKESLECLQLQSETIIACKIEAVNSRQQLLEQQIATFFCALDKAENNKREGQCDFGCKRAPRNQSVCDIACADINEQENMKTEWSGRLVSRPVGNKSQDSAPERRHIDLNLPQIDSNHGAATHSTQNVPSKSRACVSANWKKSQDRPNCCSRGCVQIPTLADQSCRYQRVHTSQLTHFPES